MLERLEADSHGARVLSVLCDPDGDARRRGRRAARIAGPIPGAAITADAAVDLATSRVPARVDVVADIPPHELRRGVRGQLRVTERHGAVDLRAPEFERWPFHGRQSHPRQWPRTSVSR